MLRSVPLYELTKDFTFLLHFNLVLAMTQEGVCPTRESRTRPSTKWQNDLLIYSAMYSLFTIIPLLVCGQLLLQLDVRPIHLLLQERVVTVEMKTTEKLLYRAYASTLASHTHGRHHNFITGLPAEPGHNFTGPSQHSTLGSYCQLIQISIYQKNMKFKVRHIPLWEYWFYHSLCVHSLRSLWTSVNSYIW